MPAIKSAAEIAAKWARVAPGRSAEFEAGVRNPRRPWAEAASAADERYKQGVTESIAQGRRNAGIKKAGDEKWQKRSIELGPSRFSQGVQVAQGDMEKGFAPYRDVIERTVLPPKFAKGDPRNNLRSQTMGQALFQARVKR